MKTLLEVVGFGCVAAAAFLVALPLGLFVFGAALIALANGNARSDV